MSHAWNACGSHIPRGFKSHILRGWPVFHVFTRKTGHLHAIDMP